LIIDADLIAKNQAADGPGMLLNGLNALGYSTVARSLKNVDVAK
jgi:hypothetical protein